MVVGFLPIAAYFAGNLMVYIFYVLWFCVCPGLQAMARVWRDGQRNKVRSYRLLETVSRNLCRDEANIYFMA